VASTTWRRARLGQQRGGGAQRISTPLAANTAPMRGRKAAACAVHQQRLGGVAGAVLLRLGVVGDGQRLLQVDLGVDVGVAVAVQVLDDRHLGLGADALDQALAAARDDHVHVLGHGDQPAHGGAVGGLDQLHGVGGRPALGQRLPAPAATAPGWTAWPPSRRAGCRRCRS
jgi:hypothetical protein